MSIFKSYFSFKCFQLKDVLWVLRFHFFKYLCFLPIELFFFTVSFFANPYRQSRKFLAKQQAKEIYAYGETPLKAFSLLIQNLRITSQDAILELGSGRGRGAFWLQHLTGCRVIGLEQVPFFVQLLKALLFFMPWKKKQLCFLQTDYLKSNFFEKATFIYLYGTDLEDSVIKQLIWLFKTAGKRLKIVTVSYSLEEYDADFYVQNSWEEVFPWGKTSVYLNVLYRT